MFPESATTKLEVAGTSCLTSALTVPAKLEWTSEADTEDGKDANGVSGTVSAWSIRCNTVAALASAEPTASVELEPATSGNGACTAATVAAGPLDELPLPAITLEDPSPLPAPASAEVAEVRGPETNEP